MNDHKSTIADCQAGGDDFITRLKFAIGNREPSKIAKAAGITKQSMSDYLTGRTKPNVEKLFNLSEATGVEAKWLAMGQGSPNQNLSKFLTIPIYSTSLSDGAGGIETMSEQIGSMAFQSAVIEKLGSEKESCFVVEFDSDAMSPTIMRGAEVLIDGADHKMTDGIWAMAFKKSLIIRRIKIGINFLELISDNQKYPPEKLNEVELNNITFLGRVIWIGQSI